MIDEGNQLRFNCSDSWQMLEPMFQLTTYLYFKLLFMINHKHKHK